MKTTVFNRLKSMSLRNLIALALFRVAFPECARKARAIVVVPLVDGSAETPGQPAPALDLAWSQSLCIDPWHPTLHGQYLAQRLGAKHVRIPKRAPKENAPTATPSERDAWGFAPDGRVIGGPSSPL